MTLIPNLWKSPIKEIPPMLQSVLVVINDLIYMGSFTYWEIYHPDQNTERKIFFSPNYWIEIQCDECTIKEDTHCCCDENRKLDEFNPSFDISEISWWMELPPIPLRNLKENNAIL